MAKSVSKKQVQMDKVDRNMFIMVGLAALVIGATVVLSYYLIREISFKTKVLIESRQILRDLDDTISNVGTLSTNVEALRTDTALSSVQLSAPECLQEDGSPATDFETMERQRACSALRVTADALPSLKGGGSFLNEAYTDLEKAYFASIERLTLTAGLPGLSAQAPGAAGEDNGGFIGEEGEVAAQIAGTGTMTAELPISGDIGMILNGMGTINRSIRLFNVDSLVMTFGEQNVEEGGEIVIHDYDPYGIVNAIFSLTAYYSSSSPSTVPKTITITPGGVSSNGDAGSEDFNAEGEF